MNKYGSFLLALLVLACALGAAASADAQQAPELRVQVNQRGDFLIVGNTLGWDCRAQPTPAPAPVLGQVLNAEPGACGVDANDSSADLAWRSDEPSVGAATASPMVTPDQARSTAFLDLPARATVSHAFLYWAGRRNGLAADTSVVLERPGAFSQAVNADDSYLFNIENDDAVYHSVAEVTDLVLANGRGAYRVSGVDFQSFQDGAEDVLFAGWSLVVLYQLDTDPPRNLTIFDGLSRVGQGAPASVRLEGFLVPDAGFDAKFGVIVYEGDQAYPGDELRFGTAPLAEDDRLGDAADGLNPLTDFFNGSRSYLGMPVSLVGDLPQLAGTPGTMAGLDLDVIDVTARMQSGQTSVDLQASSTMDVFFLGAFVTSISTFRPDFTGSQKTVSDVNGPPTLAGDVLEYTITARNIGNDESVGTVISDPLPAGVTLVPGSIRIASGPNAGVQTDGAGDDLGSYDPVMRTVTVRVGTGATANMGGSLAVGESSSITFRATIDATTRGVIANRGRIEAAGRRGAPNVSIDTDGNAEGPGTPTTDIPVAGCGGNSDCGGMTPICDTSQNPPVCVQCTIDAQCPGPGSTCNQTTHTCQCGSEPQACRDSDGDGLADPDETRNGTDPSDADSDDDGVPDGSEQGPFMDSDGDGLINARDPDSDDDGLFDGTESGYDCANPATNAALGHCRPDGDAGETRTDPINPDSDGGSARDGSEDSNLDGVLDPSERDPTTGHGSDDVQVVDGDDDGISDPTEGTIGSNPGDRDSDDDGLPDGEERNPSDDTDGDGLINVLDPDSDDDLLYDGTESGRDCSNPDTMPGHCIPDGDRGMTRTSPVVPDTDGGSARDGSEDVDRDGVIDPGERDPTVGHGADDTAVTDRDGDGLSDGVEDGIGSNPDDADSDDDGVTDGREANPGDDSDGDGRRNVLDPDSDDDQLGDGTERGSDCSDPSTDRSVCVPDGDRGATTTSMVDPDTDGGGAPDGREDSDGDGTIARGERDPNNPADDSSEMVDAGGDAGRPTADSGMRDAGGGFDGAIGNDHFVAGGGCDCSLAPEHKRLADGAFAGLFVALLWLRRRRLLRA